MMNKRIFWNTLLVLLIVGILVSGGYALYRAGHRQGYKEGLAENVDDERLSAFIEQGCDLERWSRNLGWGETHFRAGPGRGGPSKPARLAFLGLMLLLLLLVARVARSRFSRAAGGRGWQLSFGPRPPMDSAPSAPENATDE
jgi:hypothetical protein